MKSNLCDVCVVQLLSIDSDGANSTQRFQEKSPFLSLGTRVFHSSEYFQGIKKMQREYFWIIILQRIEVIFFLLVYWRKKILWFNISVTSVNCKHVSQGSCYIFLETSVKSELSWWTGALLDRPNTTLHLHCTTVPNNTHLKLPTMW